MASSIHPIGSLAFEQEVKDLADDMKANLPASSFDVVPAETYARMMLDSGFTKFMTNIVGPELTKHAKKAKNE